MNRIDNIPVASHSAIHSKITPKKIQKSTLQNMSFVPFGISGTYVMIWFSAPASTKMPSMNRGTEEKLCWVHCIPSSKLTLCMCVRTHSHHKPSNSNGTETDTLYQSLVIGEGLGEDQNDWLVSTHESQSLCNQLLQLWVNIKRLSIKGIFKRQSVWLSKQRCAKLLSEHMKRGNVLVSKRKRATSRVRGKVYTGEKNKTRIALFHVQLQNCRGRRRQKKNWTAFIIGAWALLILTAYQHWC